MSACANLRLQARPPLLRSGAPDHRRQPRGERIVTCTRNLQEPTFHEGVEALLEPPLAQFCQSHRRSGFRNIKPRRPPTDCRRSESGESRPPKGRKNDLLCGAVYQCHPSLVRQKRQRGVQLGSGHITRLQDLVVRNTLGGLGCRKSRENVKIKTSRRAP